MKEVLDILAVAKALAQDKVKVSGRRARVGGALCLNLDKGVFFDQRTSEGGDAISLIMYLSDGCLSFVDACQWYERNIADIPWFEPPKKLASKSISITVNPELIRESSGDIPPQLNKKGKEYLAELSSMPDANLINSYAMRKKICPYLAKTKDDLLIVPAYNIDAKLQTLQMITPDGDKFFLYGRAVKGSFTAISATKKGLTDRINICEGYATACSISKDTSELAICCFTASNMPVVAEIYRELYPDAEIRLCADNDHETAMKTGRNAGLEAAQKAYGMLKTNVSVVHPPSLPNISDFNDMHALHGNCGL